MINDIEQALPEQWRGFFRVLSFPIAWIFPFQRALLSWVFAPAPYPGLREAKLFFLLLPATAIVVGVWCTMMSIYTLLFRWNRSRFVGAMLILWWDLSRSTWLFWAGVGKFLFVAGGSFWGFLRLSVETVIELFRELVELPFVLTGSVTRNLRQPGVPWLAFLMTLGWAALEATIFTYILSPTVGEILSDLVGSDTHRFLGPLLFMMLGAMILGSLACMYVLVDAVKRKAFGQVLQMLVVEVFVMFVEVVFLYREFVDSLTPWITQQTGVRMTLVPVLAFSTMAWLGVRGMVWFLFARFGTPTLIALISRQRLIDDIPEEVKPANAQMHWDLVMDKLKREQAWFAAKAQALLEAAILPSFQLIAAAINFPITICLGEPLFSLPFKSLADVEETKTLLAKIGGKERVAA